MSLPLSPPLQPMLAKLAKDIPAGDGWVYEPKWDGFRVLAFVDGSDVALQSRTGQPLERYFPEVVALLAEACAEACVVDGEIVVQTHAGLDFDALQLRLHPAASRVQKLSREIPAGVVLFDLLASADRDVRGLGFAQRRDLLVSLVHQSTECFLTPQTTDADTARAWFERFEGAGLDGIIARRAEAPYLHGERAMAKIKHERTADCVVGGYRMHKSGDGVGSLLLGLYDDSGVLQYVGFTSSFRAAERPKLLERLRPYEGDGFGDGRAPGGPSRWNRPGQDTSFQSLRPELVCEVGFDHLQGGHRFRHGAKLVRWRTDKDPRDCTFEQIAPPEPFDLEDIRKLSG